MRTLRGRTTRSSSSANHGANSSESHRNNNSNKNNNNNNKNTSSSSSNNTGRSTNAPTTRQRSNSSNSSGNVASHSSPSASASNTPSSRPKRKSPRSLPLTRNKKGKLSFDSHHSDKPSKSSNTNSPKASSSSSASASAKQSVSTTSAAAAGSSGSTPEPSPTSRAGSTRSARQRLAAQQKQQKLEQEANKNNSENVLVAQMRDGTLVRVTLSFHGSDSQDSPHESKGTKTATHTKGEQQSFSNQDDQDANNKTPPSKTSGPKRGERKMLTDKDGNHFSCQVCKGFGNVVCCDGCPRVYHIECLSPSDPSRQSLENNPDGNAWYCSSCTKSGDKHHSKSKRKHQDSPTETATRTTTVTRRRTIRKKCSECQSSHTFRPLKPCRRSCGAYLHYPDCKQEPQEDEEHQREKKQNDDDDDDHHQGDTKVAASKTHTRTTRSRVTRSSIAANMAQQEQKQKQQQQEELNQLPLCSHCRVDAVVKQEEQEEQREATVTSNKRGKRYEPQQSRSREASGKHSKYEDDEAETSPEEEEPLSRLKSNVITPNVNRTSKRQRMLPATPSSSLSRKNSSHKKRKSEGGSSKKKKKKRRESEHKNESADHEEDDDEEEEEEEEQYENDVASCAKPPKSRYSGSGSTVGSGGSGSGIVQAIPAFFFFLLDHKVKIERVLSRKHRYFNRLPKGLERNELIAREGAQWWVKLRITEQKRYLALSMRDFEERVIEWKEEKTIREMLAARDPSDYYCTSTSNEDGEQNNNNLPEDENLHYDTHQRLYLATSVGSKPYTPEAGKSHNSVLLELLQDMRFHPHPMVASTRRHESQLGTLERDKVAIPYFDMHGPVATSLGDQCMGCIRGWNHFCPVLKRRMPASEHRGRLQPPLSSIMATRVGLGLRPQIPSGVHLSSDPAEDGKRAHLFERRDTEEAKEYKLVPNIPSFSLDTPSARADDIILFIEEVTAMKVPEPPRPCASPAPAASATSEPKRKSLTSRGALPMRGRRKSIDGGGETSSMGFSSSSPPPPSSMYCSPAIPDIRVRCGRCRAIVETDTGCIQCRRAQLVINTSKRPVGSRDRKAPINNTARVQTTMLGRLTLKETNFDHQDKSDREIADAILKLRWAPSAVLPPRQLFAPLAGSAYADDENDDQDDNSSSSSSDSSHDTSNSSSNNSVLMKDVGESSAVQPIADAKDANETEKSNTQAAPTDSDAILATTDISTPSSLDHADESKAVSKNVDTNAAEAPSKEATAVTTETTATTATTPTSTATTETTARPRRHRSARLVAAAAASAAGKEETLSSLDRQKLAEEHKDEANELQARCLMISCSGILLAMLRRDPLCLFAEPVPSSVIGYSTVVKNPIDFGKMKSKVIKGDYSSLGAFVSDARLLCTNALAFNPPGSIYSKTAKELLDVLEVMQKTASKWMSAIKNAHSAFFTKKGSFDRRSHQSNLEGKNNTLVDAFSELRKTWPDAVDMLESGDWLKEQLASDFQRTFENETAYYGSIAVRRAAAAAEASLAPYTYSSSLHSAVVRRSHTEDEKLRHHVAQTVAEMNAPIQLKNIPKWREKAIMQTLRRVQSRRVECSITSENGCARCDGLRIDHDTKTALMAETSRWGRNKKRCDVDTLPRVHESRLSLTTGLASVKARDRIGQDIDLGDNKGRGQDVKLSDTDDKASPEPMDTSDEGATEPGETREQSQQQEQPQQEKSGDHTEPAVPNEDASPKDSPAPKVEEDKWDQVNDVRVTVKGSKIHGWGLFADQPFKKNDVVAEYVGEYICNAVADKREKIYQERRIQDYQFRVDENLVIDATLKGGHGRYINHNCNPNCIAKIVDGKPPNKHLKRVMIIAQRDIKAREEITYDYQFPLELDLEARIPCNCSSLLCRGFMNWDLPEKGSKNRLLNTQKRGANMRDRIRRLKKPLKK